MGTQLLDFQKKNTFFSAFLWVFFSQLYIHQNVHVLTMTNTTQTEQRQQKKLDLSISTQGNNQQWKIMDNWKPVHYLKIHVHCVISWYLKDR
jgi:hypothetical protein